MSGSVSPVHDRPFLIGHFGGGGPFLTTVWKARSISGGRRSRSLNSDAHRDGHS
jgi:hypothetical protein